VEVGIAGEGRPAGHPPAVFDLLPSGDLAAKAAVWVDVEADQVPVPTAPPAAPVEGAPNLPALLDVDLPIEVRFGATDLSLLALTRLAPGAVVDLQRSPDAPVELLVGDKVVARGEVVVIGGNYGIRIIDLAGPEDRMRGIGN
jgi:flagellar motor switch protein FliN/FliY